MSESLADLLATDAELDLIAGRHGGSVHDLVLAELALLAAALDEVPLPPASRCGFRPAMSNTRKGGWALSVTVALMVTSSGVAAAVSDNPLAPLHYVTNGVWTLGPHNGGKLPGWEINGSMPISTVPGASLAGAGFVPTVSGSSLTSGTGNHGAGSGGGATVSSGSPSGDSDGPSAGGGHPPSVGGGSGPGHGHGSGHNGGGGSGGRPPGDGDGNSPGSGHQAPLPGSGNSSPSSPSRPGQPVSGAPQNQHDGMNLHPDYGAAPGVGSGTEPGRPAARLCRVDHSSIPGPSPWTSAPGLHPCPAPLLAPSQPIASARQPRVSDQPAGGSTSRSGATPTPKG